MSEMKDGGPALKLEMSEAEGFNVVIAPTDEWEGDEDYFTLIGSGTRQDVIGLAIVRAVNEHAHLLRCEEALRRALPFIDDAEDAHSVMSESSVTDECRSVVADARTALTLLDEARNGK